MTLKSTNIKGILKLQKKSAQNNLIKAVFSDLDSKILSSEIPQAKCKSGGVNSTLQTGCNFCMHTGKESLNNSELQHLLGTGIKDIRKETILFAALKIFCRKGFEAAKIDDIAGEAKCSHGLVYHYFKSKEEMFNELINFSQIYAKNNMDNPLNYNGNSLEKLKHHTEKIFYLIENNEIFVYFFYFITAINFIKKDFDLEKLYNQVHKENSPYVIIKNFFEEGIGQGLIRSGNADDFTIIYLSIIHGFIMRKLFRKNNHTCKPVSADIVISIFAK